MQEKTLHWMIILPVNQKKVKNMDNDHLYAINQLVKEESINGLSYSLSHFKAQTEDQEKKNRCRVDRKAITLLTSDFSLVQYSCIIHSVLWPFGARPVWKTKVLLVPIRLEPDFTLRSFPVAFQ